MQKRRGSPARAGQKAGGRRVENPSNGLIHYGCKGGAILDALRCWTRVPTPTLHTQALWQVWGQEPQPSATIAAASAQRAQGRSHPGAVGARACHGTGPQWPTPACPAHRELTAMAPPCTGCGPRCTPPCRPHRPCLAPPRSCVPPSSPSKPPLCGGRWRRTSSPRPRSSATGP